MRAKLRAGCSIEKRGASSSVARCSGYGSRAPDSWPPCRLTFVSAFTMLGVSRCGAISDSSRFGSPRCRAPSPSPRAAARRTGLAGSAGRTTRTALLSAPPPLGGASRARSSCARGHTMARRVSRAPLPSTMARGARHAAAVRAAIAALQADAPAHHMPALTQLVFHVPHKLDHPRLWYVRTPRGAADTDRQGPHAPLAAQGCVCQPTGGRAGRADAAQRGNEPARALWYVAPAHSPSQHARAHHRPRRQARLGNPPRAPHHGPLCARAAVACYVGYASLVYKTCFRVTAAASAPHCARPRAPRPGCAHAPAARRATASHAARGPRHAAADGSAPRRPSACAARPRPRPAS